MNTSELRAAVESANPDGNFFDRKTMKFFGDTMRNYGVRKVSILVMYNGAGDYVGPKGEHIEAWELYRRNAVKHGNKQSAYFRADDFRHTFPSE